jgi:hypothetical protein
MKETIYEPEKSSKAALYFLRSNSAQLTQKIEVFVLFCHVYACVCMYA